MMTEVVPYLRCPVCRATLAAGGEPPGRAVCCPRGHSFDVARQGYVDLSAGSSPHVGDTAGMVAARAGFLAAGHYDFLSAALSAAATGHAPTARLVLDAGAGTGHHLAALLEGLPAAVGLALDVAKPAVRRAARAHPRAAAVRCDTWGRMPVADGVVDVLVNVFAPRNGAEFRRVLAPGGVLLVAVPAADHLAELVDRLGLLRVDPGKRDRVAASLDGRFAVAADAEHRRELRLSRAEVRTLVAMGPSAWHTEPDRLAAAVAELPESVPVTAAVRLTTYTGRS